ncbi:MAG: glycosyl hydrolase [Candidatus Entotheonella factor]|uniref:Glycosyl hydrolase n=1 Tax=Entotheonella factor TaxID=1429438 RepID=W4LKG6_ENTF1|nr:MAG: glycosyl hydrolase [Candidatus Entotheonella factor]
MTTAQTDLIGLFGQRPWRCIGPFRGGRVVAVAGDVSSPMVFYFGACAGGVWKTTDGGTYWQNISDGYFKTSAVGALAVSISDPNVIYAGMGETAIRGDVSHGDGVYKSTDAGKTWTHLGLDDTRYIARVRIHPQNPDWVYVAALGHIYGPNAMRGVYRSKDGGASWEQVLFRSENAGAIDLCMDPTNPRILYAAMWETRRTPWSLSSGGPDSSLYKSTDGGDTWTELTHNPGLPTGLRGKAGVAASPAKPERVWAIMEAEDGGLFRSDDGGETWKNINEDRNLRARPWYYCHIVADPQDADTVYILNVQAWKSIDGGHSFTRLSTPHGDNHDLWIDPQHPERMIEGNDGGACISFNGAATWSTIYNQPTAQFYHVDTDNHFPYRVYGTQQDNSAVAVPNRSHKGAILWGDCYAVGNSESGYIAVHPNDPNIVFSGAIGSAPGGGGTLLRYDHATGQVRIVTVWPEVYGGWGAKDIKYRFQWTYPICFSPHDANVLYVAGNRVFRSTNEGASWEAISPDLTRNDESKLGPSGGPITKDTTGAEHYCTIFAFAESPHEPGVFWSGSDDGLLHISRDHGATWTQITPPDLPEWALISMIDLSPHDPASAYLAATRYRLDDSQPYVYKTQDYGATWERISNGLPPDDFTRAIREDPNRRGLLYVGTETGLYISLDDGASWQPMQGNLPVVPVYDLVVKERDLVVATHGRSFWILDDLTPLYQLTDEIAQRPFHLFAPRPTYRLPGIMGGGRPAEPGKNYRVAMGYAATFTESQTPEGDTVRTFLDAGTNPPAGVIVTYCLRQPVEAVTLRFLDAQGELIREFSSSPEANQGRAPHVATTAGTHRFVWNMRYADAHAVAGDKSTERELTGPVAPPGQYQVELRIGEESQRASFDIRTDPRLSVTPDELQAQFDLLIRIRDKVSETHDAINQMDRVSQQTQEWVDKTGEQPQGAAIAEAAQGLREAIDAIEQELIEKRIQAPHDRLHYPARLNLKLNSLSSVVASADTAPTQQAYEVFDDLSAKIDQQLERWQQLLQGDVANFSQLVRQSDVPAIVP